MRRGRTRGRSAGPNPCARSRAPLEATGHTAWSASPFDFFTTLRDPQHGGWSYSGSFIATDANSTALVLQAYASALIPVPLGGLIALRKLQHRACGAWAYNWNGDVL